MGRGGNAIGRIFVYTIIVSLVALMTVTCANEGEPQHTATDSESKMTEQVPVTKSTSSDAAPADGEMILPPEDSMAQNKPISDTARVGEELFNANCSVCHGVGATGTDQGPPLIHMIYHPGHHADFSFRNAVRQGVKQHHWGFGDMAPLEDVSAADVEKIICYVREQQRAAGIFEGDSFSTVC